MSAPTRVRRTTWLDWYVDGDESAVMVGANVVVLSALASALLEAVAPDGWTAVAEVVVALREEFGDPVGTSAEAATADALRDLAAEGVVELD